MFSVRSPKTTRTSENDKLRHCEEQQLREFKEIIANEKTFDTDAMSLLPNNVLRHSVKLFTQIKPVYMVLAVESAKYPYLPFPLGSRFVTQLTFLSPLFVPQRMHRLDPADREVAGCTRVQLVKNYDDVQPGDKLFIWNCLDRGGGGTHLSGVIKTATGKYINFGFFPNKLENRKIQEARDGVMTGMLRPYRAFVNSNFSTYEGLVQSLDDVFLLKLTKQLNNPSQKFVKLVNVVELTDVHVDNLKNTFDSIYDTAYEKIGYTAMGVMQPSQYCSARDKREFIETLEEIREKIFSDSLNYQINEYNAYAKSPDASCKAFFFGRVDIPFPKMYRRYASATNKTCMNCTSFFDQLFPGVISCGVIGHYVAEDPARCVAGPMAVAECDSPVVGEGLRGGRSRRRKRVTRPGATVRRKLFGNKRNPRRRRTGRFFAQRR
jgi:hypothetical protein